MINDLTLLEKIIQNSHRTSYLGDYEIMLKFIDNLKVYNTGKGNVKIRRIKGTDLFFPKFPKKSYSYCQV